MEGPNNYDDDDDSDNDDGDSNDDDDDDDVFSENFFCRVIIVEGLTK